MDNPEIEIILAFLFKRSGKEELSQSEIYLPLSMNLKWYTLQQARSFINLALNQKLLIKKGEMLTPNFDYKKVAIPIGFQPSKQIVVGKEDDIKKEENLVNKIIIKIAKKTKLDKKEITEKISKAEKEKNINTELAALLIGREYGVEVAVFFDEIEEIIFRGNKE